MDKHNDEQMQQDKQNQGNDDQHKQTYENFSAEESKEMDAQQQQGNRQSASLYEPEDDDESTPRSQWAAPNTDTEEFE